MQVRLLDRTLDYVNDAASVDKLFQELDNILEDPGLVVSGMIIDNAEVYESYKEYILDRIDRIQTIDIIIDTVENSIDDILASMRSYLDRAVPELELLTGDIYAGGVDDSSIDKLEQLAEGINWIVSMICHVNNCKDFHSILKDSGIWNKCISFVTRLSEEFVNLKDAIGNSDMILIADILKYEITEIFMELNLHIKQIYGHGVEGNVN